MKLVHLVCYFTFIWTRPALTLNIVRSEKPYFLLSVLPEEVTNGYTDSVEVTCQYKNTNDLKIVSISILHSAAVGNPDFKYLCSINTFSNRIQKYFPYLRNVSGAIDSNQESHISLTLDDSPVNKLGLYKCEVIGVNVKVGKPAIDSKESLLQAPENKINAAVDVFRNQKILMKESIENLQTRCNNITLEVNEIKRIVNRLELNVTELNIQDERTKVKIDNFTKLNREFLNDLQSLNHSILYIWSNYIDIKNDSDKVRQMTDDNYRELNLIKNQSIFIENVNNKILKIDSSIEHQQNLIKLGAEKCEAVKKVQDEMAGKLLKLTIDPMSIYQNSLNSLFIASNSFKGRRYWLTRKSYNILITDAHAMCMKYGGYLVEIDSEEEFEFVRSFLRNKTTFQAVFAGGTDSIHEGVWINRFSMLKVTFFNWLTGEPNNHDGNEHCQCFWQFFEYLMNDCKCNFVNDSGFLCEIPEEL